MMKKDIRVHVASESYAFADFKSSQFLLTYSLLWLNSAISSNEAYVETERGSGYAGTNRIESFTRTHLLGKEKGFVIWDFIGDRNRVRRRISHEPVKADQFLMRVTFAFRCGQAVVTWFVLNGHFVPLVKAFTGMLGEFARDYRLFEMSQGLLNERITIESPWQLRRYNVLEVFKEGTPFGFFESLKRDTLIMSGYNHVVEDIPYNREAHPFVPDLAVESVRAYLPAEFQTDKSLGIERDFIDMNTEDLLFSSTLVDDPKVTGEFMNLVRTRFTHIRQKVENMLDIAFRTSDEPTPPKKGSIAQTLLNSKNSSRLEALRMKALKKAGEDKQKSEAKIIVQPPELKAVTAKETEIQVERQITNLPPVQTTVSVSESSKKPSVTKAPSTSIEEKERLTNENANLKAMTQQQRTYIKELEQKLYVAESELSEQKQRNEFLADQLSAKNVANSRTDLVALGMLLADPSYKISASEALHIAETISGGVLVVLPSAKKSASEVSEFENGNRLLTLLMRLVQLWLPKFIESGDTEARKVFTTKTYSATESQTLKNTKRLTQARTFSYQGREIQMLRHLCIGVTHNPSKTIRVYFEFLHDEGKIVIGWCGEHLPICKVKAN